MGVVNVTPDSFSDGGRWLEPDAAVAHGRELLADGADILDIGGESTRPGATRPLVEEELGRVVPVIAALAAEGAVGLGRHDARRGRRGRARRGRDDRQRRLRRPRRPARSSAWSRPRGATYVAMHWRAHADHMSDFAVYDGPGGVVAAVRDELAERVEAILAAGVAPGADRARPRARLRQARRAQLGAAARPRPGRSASGYPLLVGASRKSFLGRLLADPAGTVRPVDEREHASTALTVLLAQRGVWGLRVHDVRAARDALRVRRAR